MSRSKAAETILDAADKWKQECLVNGGSLFGDEELWTGEHFGALRTYFVERPDEGKRSFEEKLRTQLEPAPPEAKRLWAEITWLYYLIVSSEQVTRKKKLDRIRMVWEWSQMPLPEDHWALDDVLDAGVIRPGRAYIGLQWREFRFIVTLMIEWYSRPATERASLLQDPWEFAEWVDRQQDGRQHQFRHALLFLLFPDTFEAVMSQGHKREIIKACHSNADEPSDVDRMSLVDLDKALLEVRKQLQKEYPGQEVHFYKSPFREKWKGDSPKDDDHADEIDDKAWYENRFGVAEVWVVAPGDGARLWREFQEQGVAAIGLDELGDLSEYESRDAIHGALVENGFGEKPSNTSLAAWEFANEMKVGDVVIAKRGRSTILGWGEVAGGYAHDVERPEYRNLRRVKWHPCPKPIALEEPITTKMLTRFTSYRNWLRHTFELIDTGGKTSRKRQDEEETPPYDIDTALSGLFLEASQFNRILDSIALRRNLILQGPPGVGKTFIARRIAWCLIGRRDSRPIEMVQFHQSYAYEDFVQGWRPTETGGFKLRNGVFFEFCKRAEQQPGTPFVFIIDEINRGNLSRTFGELLMLIEADKRGPKHELALTYAEPGERFSIPDNVYLLGLMNTADRSLAIVDYALRRRFAFETLRPAYGTRAFREYLLEADVDSSLVDRIVTKFTGLNERIRNDKDLGEGFEIGHSYFVPEGTADESWYRGIIDTQIEPLLREYWFDRPEEVNRRIEELLR